MRVELEDGQWAEIFPVGEMPRRVTVHLQDMFAEIPDEQPGTAYLRDMERLRDTLMAMVVKQWSYGDPPGDEASGVYDLPQDAYDKLRRETRPHWEKAGFTEKEETEPEEEKPKRARSKKPTSSTSSA